MKRGEETLSGKPTKQDILYSRARYVLNQRHIKRPWFNLNPFLERTDEQIDLENFVPDESRYIQKLESLVLCENFTNDFPLDTRELTIATFFPYIYSDIWKDGISVRILEGQLFDELIMCLYRLEEEGFIVRHKTYAFARNQRPRLGCYKFADKEAFGHIDETLLIEFTYFGPLGKPQPNLVTTNPLAYLHRPQSRSQILQDRLNPKIILPEIGVNGESQTGSEGNATESGSLTKKSPHGKDNSPQSHRGRSSFFSKPINVIRAVGGMMSTRKRQSVPASGPVPFIKASTQQPEKQRESDPDSPEAGLKQPHKRRANISGTGFSSVRTPKNLKKLLAEAAEYETLAELEQATKFKVKLEDSVPAYLSFDDDKYYGEELYLSDSKLETLKTPVKAEEILQRKKKELQQRRFLRKQHEEEQKRKLKGVNIRSEIRPLTKVEPERTVNFDMNMPDKVPTFEEFLKLLKEDVYADPRYRNKDRRRAKKMVQLYSQGKDALRSRLDKVSSQVSGSRLKTSSGTVSMGAGSRPFVQLPTLVEHDTGVTDVTRFAEEVHGVTDSEPCKQHCLQALGTEEECKEKEKPVTKQAAKAKQEVYLSPDIVVLSPSGNQQHIVYKTPCTSPLFPRISVGETPDIGSDDDTDDEEDTASSFDSTKLNLKYSIERLRKKKKKAKKKPAFFDVLRKYYRAQAVLQAFRKETSQKERKVARDRAQKISFSKSLKRGKAEAHPPSPPMVIGKLKHFKFLDKKIPNNRQVRLDKIHMADFSTPDKEDFYKQMKRSLNDFVVRREVVASDLNARCATSITFTRIQCFQPKKQN